MEFFMIVNFVLKIISFCLFFTGEICQLPPIPFIVSSISHISRKCHGKDLTTAFSTWITAKLFSFSRLNSRSAKDVFWPFVISLFCKQTVFFNTDLVFLNHFLPHRTHLFSHQNIMKYYIPRLFNTCKLYIIKMYHSSSSSNNSCHLLDINYLWGTILTSVFSQQPCQVGFSIFLMS